MRRAIPKEPYGILMYQKGNTKIMSYFKDIDEAAHNTGIKQSTLRKYLNGILENTKYDFKWTEKTYICKWGEWWEAQPIPPDEDIDKR